MPYTKHEERTFSHTSEELFKAVKAATVGRKLMFGARKGVTQTVLTWFRAHDDHSLE